MTQIPELIFELKKAIVKELPDVEQHSWLDRFTSAFEPGRDYSRVGWQFLHWLLTDQGVNPGISAPLMHNAVEQCANIMEALAHGVEVKEADIHTAQMAAWMTLQAATQAKEAAQAASFAILHAAKAHADMAAWSAAEEERQKTLYSTMAKKLIEMIEAQ